MDTDPVATIWAGFAGLTALIWLARHRMVSRTQRGTPPLTVDPRSDASEEDLPPLTVVVAAKDEEANIERCVRSLLRQTYPRLHVVAVNDRSTDQTGTILDRMADEDERLAVVHVTQLQAGWFGKPNAMRVGVEQASTPWLLFTDADCTFTSPRALATAAHHALLHETDFLSVLPTLEAQSLLEQVIQPACGGILLIWFNPVKVNDAASSTAYANGAFMLMTRDAYDRIGGHEPVKTEVNEDMHMARRAKQAGLRLRVVPNDGLYCVRMYADLRQMWNGWSRIFYGCFGGYRKMVLSFAAVLLVGIQPWISLIVGGWLTWFASDPAPWKPLFTAGAAACVFQVTVMIRYYRSTKIAAWLAPTYPFAACLALGMLISAMRRLHGRGTTTWRGTTYRGDAVVQAERSP